MITVYEFHSRHQLHCCRHKVINNFRKNITKEEVVHPILARSVLSNICVQYFTKLGPLIVEGVVNHFLPTDIFLTELANISETCSIPNIKGGVRSYVNYGIYVAKKCIKFSLMFSYKHITTKMKFCLAG
jgi:hypothetical protein